MNKQSLVELLLNDGKKEDSIIRSFYPKKRLCPDIFDEDNQMKEEIRKRLLSISNNFINYLGVDFFIHDVILTGSMSSYGWSKYSDIDLHIIIDFKESKHNTDLLKEFFDSKKYSWNKTYNIKIKNYEIELYIQDINETLVSNGIYSILNNKWNSKPEKLKIIINEKLIRQKSEQYMKIIDELIKRAKNNEDVYDEILSLRDKIKIFRKIGLSKNGEFSYENLTFKFLRRNGYIKKLLNLKNSLINKKLSIK